MTLPVIFSCEGLTVTDSEFSFFRESCPLGFILFKRNVDTPEQLRALTQRLRESVGEDCPILIDQEGGRVQRMGPPHWPAYPAAQDLKTVDDVSQMASVMARDLAEVGIDVNCAPVTDVLCAETHEAIGNRAYSDKPSEVFEKSRAVCEAYLSQGVTPVIKHLPGQGRAACDSHHDLPVVKAAREDLEAVDFAPVRQIAAAPFADQIWGMIAHVVYEAIDPELPATISPSVHKLIREDIGFNGFIVSDDISMGALKKYGNPAERAVKILAAGSDAALYCAGKLEEMTGIADASLAMSPESLKRYERSRIRRRPAA